MNNEITKPQGTSINVENMTNDEMSALTEQMLHARQKLIERKMKELEDKYKKNEAKINELSIEQNNVTARVDILEKETEILCSYKYRKERKQFMYKAASRVKFLLGGDPSTIEYTLFSPFFFKGIYSDIGYELGIGDWCAIDMTDYKSSDSQYERAKSIRDNWMPSSKYFHDCLRKLVEKRDNGTLKPERCRALTAFLNATDNAKHVAFLRN